MARVGLAGGDPVDRGRAAAAGCAHGVHPFIRAPRTTAVTLACAVAAALARDGSEAGEIAGALADLSVVVRGGTRHTASAVTYRRDLKKAAHRHLAAADSLYPHVSLDLCRPNDRPDVAGYLYGIAAECGLKEIMRASGMRERDRDERRNDPFYLHFPGLKAALRDRVEGRAQGLLLQFANDDKLMSEWDIEMRYADGADVRSKPIGRWKSQAHDIVQKMEDW